MKGTVMISQQYTATSVVLAIGSIHIEGNIIPHTWYGHLKTSTGTPHTTAILILSEVLYWYRPTAIRDEQTGRLLGYRRKFRADKLQRSYQSFVDQFGFTKGQVKAAVDYLVNEGYLMREFRNITLGDLKLSNVMYLEPVPAAIARITAPHAEQDTPQGVEQVEGGGVGSLTHQGYVAGGTNTEIITETVTDIKTAANAAAAEPPVSETPPVKEKATRKRADKGAAKRPRTYTAMQLAVCRVCKLDSEVLSNSMFGRVRAAGNALEGKYTPEQVYQVFGDGAIWWKVWPGNENRPPRPEEVRDKINDLLTRPANGNGRQGANGDGRRKLPTLADFERESKYEQLLEKGVKPDVARRQAGLA